MMNCFIYYYVLMYDVFCRLHKNLRKALGEVFFTECTRIVIEMSCLNTHLITIDQRKYNHYLHMQFYEHVFDDIVYHEKILLFSNMP